MQNPSWDASKLDNIRKLKKIKITAHHTFKIHKIKKCSMKLEIKKSNGKSIASLHTFGATTKIDRENLYAL
jgi:hypothetical protein